MDLKILVVNCKDSFDRRNSMSKQLDKLSIPYEFLEATEGRSLSADWIENNTGGKLKDYYINKKHFSINKNAIACADSHRRAQLIAANDDNSYTLILEDDVVLSKSFKKKIMQVCSLMQEHSLHLAFPGFQLFNGAFERRFDISSSKQVSAFRYPVDGRISGGYSYIVDSIGARKLLEGNEDKIQYAADEFCINEKSFNDETILIFPKLVTTGYFDSDIGYPLANFTFKQKIKKSVYSLSTKSGFVQIFTRFYKERRL